MCGLYRKRYRPLAFDLTLGLSNALLCSEAVAKMILGKELPEDFPLSFLVTDERLQKTLNVLTDYLS